MKRILLIAVAILLVSVLLLGGNVFGETKKVKIGLSWNEKLHSLIQAWEDYMVKYSKEYGKEKGLEFEWVITVADSDPLQQAANIENLISQGVDLIIARAHDAAAIGASIKAAREAGIPFVTFDRECSTDTPTAHVGADSYNQAVTTGLYFAGLMKGLGIKGKVIEVMGDLRDMNAVYRSQGWHYVEDMLGMWETVAQVPTEWNPEKFYTGVKNALQANPDANALFVHSDFCFSAVEKALAELGRLAPVGDPKHVWIAAQDTNPQGYDALKKGYIDVATTYDAYFHAVEAVKVITSILLGEKIPQGQKFLVGGRVATPDNVEKLENMWAREYRD
ncbi:MAG: sugar ABC transporter substrate-binding protein [Candidatus Caldatribacteriaceae bacterium]